MKKVFLILLCALLLAGCGGEKETVEPTEPPVLLEDSPVGKTDTELRLQGSATVEELRQVLEQRPALKSIYFEQCHYTPQERKELLQDFPDLRFDWPLCYGETELRSTDRLLDLSHETLDVEALCELLEQCRGMERVELGERSLSIEEAELLYEAASEVLFVYDTDFFGQRLSTACEEIDLSGTKIEDIPALERELIRFRSLKKLVMCECGIDDETMDALNRKYEDIRFVWMVQVYNRGIRTDTDHFILYNCEKQYSYNNGSCKNLRYCPDLIAVDLGHMFISGEELEFLYDTPHIKYLVVIDGLYRDITPIGSLKELEYLEMFSSQVEDLSPLLECANLKHLNISRCLNLKEDCFEVLTQMKQLKRLWFIGTYLDTSYGDTLTAALPDTEIHYDPFTNGYAPYSMDYNWRKDASYYAMRDALQMYYMDNEK